METDIENRPLPLRVMTLMDVIPGRADIPKTGEPISIITFSHRGEIEPSILLNVRDTKKMAVCMLAVLAHHEEPKAKEIMAKYFTEEEEDEDGED